MRSWYKKIIGRHKSKLKHNYIYFFSQTHRGIVSLSSHSMCVCVIKQQHQYGPRKEKGHGLKKIKEVRYIA
jgi:hypothetical protein